MGKIMYTAVTEKQQMLMLFLLEIILIALIGSLMTYGPEANANLLKNHTGIVKSGQIQKPQDDPLRIYPKVTSEHICLMTRTLRWLRRHIVDPCTMLIRIRKCSPLEHAITLLLIEGFLLCGFLALYDYAPEVDASNRLNSVYPYLNGQSNSLPVTHILYQDVHVMIWIGFGFLMTFLKRYSQSAVGLTFLIGAILVQVALLCDGAMNVKLGQRAYISLGSLLSADVAVATPLISMGAVLGKVTYMQLVFMGIVELIMFTVNKYVGEHLFMAVDAGDSMFVHVFGAYFGLAISFVLGTKEKSKENELEGSSYQSDVFAMIGTVFLWLFWPSFNSAALTGDDQQRAIINTLLSISASCVITFAVSALVSKDNKFNMVHVQNSTLAGGVAIGTAAGMMCEPVGALVIGAISGVISVLGYKYLTPFIQKHLHIHDTCGVHNLHGMPGVLAAFFGALMASLATEATYDYSLYEIFPARAPSSETKISEMRDDYGISTGFNRTAYQQAGYQLLALAVTLGISIVSGLITGLLLRTMICGWVTEQQRFDDGAVWELEDEFPQEFGKNRTDNTRPNDHINMGNI
ncbi:PREDICTED: ammonium transporter Rh type A isoform X3 [Wasmannia auropunctata]|uniref:ammonium transporter Rh type A isoform X3 n=1 Tax=Wasmannia auropunctata TaxID=64793 RepID=UPI0005EFF337|nr:PREDICTED: ammonium transporter Rh type A isoform X3 [Wasmannia auropunctata]